MLISFRLPQKRYHGIILVNLLRKFNVLKKQILDFRESLFRITFPDRNFVTVYPRSIFNIYLIFVICYSGLLWFVVSFFVHFKSV